MDGMHRVVKAAWQRRERIEAVQFECSWRGFRAENIGIAPNPSLPTFCRHKDRVSAAAAHDRVARRRLQTCVSCGLSDLWYFHGFHELSRWRLNRSHQSRDHCPTRDETQSLCPGARPPR